MENLPWADLTPNLPTCDLGQTLGLNNLKAQILSVFVTLVKVAQRRAKK